MQLKNTITLLAMAASLAPAMVTAAQANSCNTKVIRTSYQRISPSTVKETKVFEKTRLISKAAPHKRTIIRKVAYLAPRSHTTVTTTRTTTMFVPTTAYAAPMIVKPVVVAPATTVIRAAAIEPRETTVIKTQSFVVPTQTLSSNEMIAAPGDTVVFKEKHGKLKEIGTLKPVVWY